MKRFIARGSKFLTLKIKHTGPELPTTTTTRDEPNLCCQLETVRPLEFQESHGGLPGDHAVFAMILASACLSPRRDCGLLYLRVGSASVITPGQQEMGTSCLRQQAGNICYYSGGGGGLC